MPVVDDLREFAKDLFKCAQQPNAWLLSAERLRDAGNAILKHELQNEVPYFRAHAAAEQEAVADAYSDGKEWGVAEVKAAPPNYPPAQLLFAYAIENVLKGLIVATAPQLIEERELSRELKSHNLIKLAEKANFAVHPQEKPVLEALSQLSVWAGRYPVASKRHEYVRTPNSDELLDYGAHHSVMRGFFERARNELESRLPQPNKSGFSWLAVRRQPGT
jgi:hypothetical protein